MVMNPWPRFLAYPVIPVCQTTGGELVRCMVDRVEYDLSIRVCVRKTVIGLPMQSPRGANFSIGGRLPWPLAGAGAAGTR